MIEVQQYITTTIRIIDILTKQRDVPIKLAPKNLENTKDKSTPRTCNILVLDNWSDFVTDFG